MNINRHNYEEYLLDYLEGTLTPEAQQVVEAFLSANPDVAEEVNALLTGMPVLVPDESVVYAHKETLKKTESARTIAFKNNNRFFVLSLAAAFILFALGWWAIANFNGLTNITNSPQLAEQSAHTGKPAANTPQTQPNPTQPNNTANRAAVETQTPINTAKVPASGNTDREQAVVRPSVTAKNDRTKSAVASSGLPVNKEQGAFQPNNPALPTSEQPAGIQLPAKQVPLQTNPKTIVGVLPVQPKTAIWVTANSYTPTVLAMQTYGVNKAGLEPATGNQLLAQENTRQSKALRTVGKLLFDRKKERRQPINEEDHEGLMAQLTGSIIPEAYRQTNEPIDASISFSVAVNSNTHRIIRDLFNR